ASAANQRLDQQEAIRQQTVNQMPFLESQRGAIAPTPLMPEQQQQYIEQNVMPRIEETNKLAQNLDYLYSQDATSIEGSKNIQSALSEIDRTLLTDEARA